MSVLCDEPPRHTAWLAHQFPHRVHFLDNREGEVLVTRTSGDVTAE
jgi:hypothetical protein